MYGEAVIHAGFIAGEFYDHRNYEDRIRKHTPEVCEKFTVKHYKRYGDCFLNLNFGNKVIGINAALPAYAPHEIYRWLECICWGFGKTYYLIDEEGPLTMIKCDQCCDYLPYIRLTILSSDERYFDQAQDKCLWNEETEKEYIKTKETQIIADYLIKKEDFVSEIFRELEAYMKSLTRSDYFGIRAEHKPSIPHVRKFLKGIDNGV
jgi:hypothetical protein